MGTRIYTYAHDGRKRVVSGDVYVACNLNRYNVNMVLINIKI